MVKVVKSCSEWSGERSGLLWKLLQVGEIILVQGSLSLIPPEGLGMDTVTSGSPSDLESRSPQEQVSPHCRAGHAL